jgi:phospholipid/cholesterol/gamma-HCH transport system substrate-binding protein
VLDYVGLYKRELAAFFALDSAATQATDLPPGRKSPLHYLRTTNPVNPEALAVAPRRLATNRPNPYLEPGGYGKLPGGLEVFGSYLCGTAPTPALVPSFVGQLADQIKEFVYGGTTNAGAAPACKPQAPLGRVVGQSGVYPRLEPLPNP